MCRFSVARLSSEAMTEESPLSIYSTSGLFIKSHVDIVSSKETESPEKLEDSTIMQDARLAAAAGLGPLLTGSELLLLDLFVFGLMVAEVTAELRLNLASRAPVRDPFFTVDAELVGMAF